MTEFAPWDTALDRLETHVGEPDFVARWRGFERDCSLLLLPELPVEASVWMSLADAYDEGKCELDELTHERVRAWQFLESYQQNDATVEPKLRIVINRMWPHVTDDWYDTALYFVQELHRANVNGEQWWPLLQARFDPLLKSE